MNRIRPRYILLLLLFITFTSLFLSIRYGSVAIPLREVFTSFYKHQHSLSHEIIWRIRLPRVINAFTTGGLLALSGCLLQTLLRNPLADPYILGISGGSAVVTLLAIFFGVSGYYLHGFAFFGGLLAMFIVLHLSYRKQDWQTSHLLLTGVIFAAGCNAIISLILTLSPNDRLRNMMFWLLGDLSGNKLYGSGLFVLCFAFIFIYSLARPLDILNYGELKATSLGVNTKRLMLIIYLLTALMTATAVSIAGCVGFIGLITPHLLRLMKLHSHAVLLPGCLLLGGSIVSVADMLSRTLIAPQQLPVGVITAFIGVPVFLFMLRKKA